MTPQPLDNDEEVLFRQIHPNFYDNGYPGSLPFAPSAKDNNKLSVDRSSLTTAAGSHALFTGNGFKSVAVYGVSVAEFGTENIPCYPDPLGAEATLAANPAHAYADFSTFSPTQGKKIAKRLRNNAVKRGRLHP
ncbi:MAG: hypothetical protein HIU82_04890 [Proteobacteria bacterium]|nr:hypothetical protein [Pseudomonadota bacterium]